MQQLGSQADDEADEQWRVLSAVSEMPFLTGNSADLLIDVGDRGEVLEPQRRDLRRRERHLG